MSNRLKFYDFMRAGHVKRWHIINTVRNQTLAEHGYLVTIIALELYRLIVGGDRERDSEEILQLIMGAMFDDAPEIRYGDYPTPAKSYLQDKVPFPIFKAMDDDLMPEIPYIGGRIPGRLLPFIKMADAIEAAHWIHENKAGIHADIVAKGCARRMMELVDKFSRETNTDWYEPVNKVLMELGMPYVSQSLRQTPP